MTLYEFLDKCKESYPAWNQHHSHNLIVAAMLMMMSVVVLVDVKEDDVGQDKVMKEMQDTHIVPKSEIVLKKGEASQ